MGNENTYKYKGVKVTFIGFYEDKFAFTIDTRIVLVKSIEELEQHLLKKSE